MKRRDFIKSLAVAPAGIAAKPNRESVTVDVEIWASDWGCGRGWYLYHGQEAGAASRAAVEKLQNLTVPQERRPASITIHKDGFDIRFKEKP